jgi:hypothetical protein
VDLDEVEVQKGVLQVSRALAFLHGPGKSVHLNLSPEAVLINAKVSLFGPMRKDARDLQADTGRVTGSCPD